MNGEPADPRLCPCCEVLLQEGRDGGISLLGCGDCGGLWLDNATCQAIIARYNPSAERLARLADQNAASPQVIGGFSKKCPVCSRPLERVRTTSKGIQVDICGEHGTWFDRTELLEVLGALHPRLPPLPPPPTFDAPRPAPPMPRQPATAEQAPSAREIAGEIESARMKFERDQRAFQDIAGGIARFLLD